MYKPSYIQIINWQSLLKCSLKEVKILQSSILADATAQKFIQINITDRWKFGYFVKHSKKEKL